MVAAQSADRAPDVSIASELGSLLHVHRSIRHPYWRLQALVRLAPLYAHFGLARDRLVSRDARGLLRTWDRAHASSSPPCRTPSERFIALVDAIWEQRRTVARCRGRGCVCRARQSTIGRLVRRTSRGSISGFVRSTLRSTAFGRSASRAGGRALCSWSCARHWRWGASMSRSSRRLDFRTGHAAAGRARDRGGPRRTDGYARRDVCAVAHRIAGVAGRAILAVPGAPTSPALDQRVLVVRHPRDAAIRGSRSGVDARWPAEALLPSRFARSSS